MPINKKNLLSFATAIITYPSDFNKLLTLDLIKSKFESVIDDSTKLVISKEDADEEIQRNHYHIYFDINRRSFKNVSQKYFDIPLPQPIVAFYNNEECEHLLQYYFLSELESQLGWDNGEEMVKKLEKYCSENEYGNYKVLHSAHPNIKLKLEYGHKYWMLRYVLKQHLLSRSISEDEKGLEKLQNDLAYLSENSDELKERKVELMENDQLAEYGLEQYDKDCLDELQELGQFYLKYLERQAKKDKRNGGDSGKKRGQKRKRSARENAEWNLSNEIRDLMIRHKGITKAEMLKKIRENEEYWFIYVTSYLNYNKLINDLFQNKPNAKPKRNYDLKFWLPKELYDYIQWLDHWVECWMTGRKEELEHRPKGLVLIGDSRTGKTSLLSLIGDFSYFKNIWNSDNWEFLPPYTIMDDMDAQDEGKGLAFSWYKPWFGAQDAITITDKYKPKVDIVNGKPLIWLNNFDIKDTFPSEAAQNYIHKNMIIINIGNRSLFEKPDMRVLGNYTNYREFDPKSTWYYREVVSKPKPESEPESEPTPVITPSSTEPEITESVEQTEPLDNTESSDDSLSEEIVFVPHSKRDKGKKQIIDDNDTVTESDIDMPLYTTLQTIMNADNEPEESPKVEEEEHDGEFTPPPPGHYFKPPQSKILLWDVENSQSDESDENEPLFFRREKLLSLKSSKNATPTPNPNPVMAPIAPPPGLVEPKNSNPTGYGNFDFINVPQQGPSSSGTTAQPFYVDSVRGRPAKRVRNSD